MTFEDDILTSIDPSDIDADGLCAIPNWVERIGAYVFEGCTSLQSIHLPEGLKGIGCSAFKGCTSLKSIRIPNSLECFFPSIVIGCPCLEEVICQRQDKIDDFEFTLLIGEGHLTHRILEECKERVVKIWTKKMPKPHLLNKLMEVKG